MTKQHWFVRLFPIVLLSFVVSVPVGHAASVLTPANPQLLAARLRRVDLGQRDAVLTLANPRLLAADVPELGYCELVDAEEWVSGTLTRPVQLQRCIGPDDEWIRANPGKRVSAADLVPVDTPPAAVPATIAEASNTTR